MIRYTLKCPSDHDFESWFQSATAFDTLLKSGHLTCPACGSADVAKSLMAPTVRPARGAAAVTTKTRPNLSRPGNDMETAFAAMRKQVEENSEYVGMNFVAEARRIYDGDAPERSIYGEAKPEEARRLIEDGVPVAPMPFMPARKVN